MLVYTSIFDLAFIDANNFFLFFFLTLENYKDCCFYLFYDKDMYLLNFLMLCLFIQHMAITITGLRRGLPSN